MPVKKKKVTPPKKEQGSTPEKKLESSCHMFHCNCYDFGKKVMWTLFGILLAYCVVWMGTLIRNNLQEFYYIGQADKMERTITVNGVGEITAKPDIAMTTMGMVAEGMTVLEAQQKNTEVMNLLVDKLKGLGILDDDIQTANYNIYPRYDYTEDEGRQLEGYEVRQNVSVKIRNLEKANHVLALAGEVGANNVSGLQFTIDDDEVYKAQAREEALVQVAKKARSLSQSLGVQLVDIVAYNEYEAGKGYPEYRAMADSAYGLGGSPLPSIESGSMDVSMNVSVTFEIR
jgi:uncharacterized protein